MVLGFVREKSQVLCSVLDVSQLQKIFGCGFGGKVKHYVHGSLYHVEMVATTCCCFFCLFTPNNKSQVIRRPSLSVLGQDQAGFHSLGVAA